MAEQLPINLLDLLNQRTVEGERIEYKAGWNPDAIISTVCAFANDFANLGSGYVVIGQDCDANGQPIFPPKGLAANQLDRIPKELQAYCQLIKPQYFPLLTIEQVEGRNLIVPAAPGGQNRPYKAPAAVTAKHKTWHYFVRRYSSTVEAKGKIEQELLGLAAKIPFDDRIAHNATVEELSRQWMEALLEEVGNELASAGANLSPEALGRQTNVGDGSLESLWPKNVGLLFFKDAPEKFFQGTQIDVVWFPEGVSGDRFVEKTFKGPLSRMTREALSYIQRNYLHETVIKHPQQAEAERFWNFPFAAIEEAVVNAVYHRSYEEREPIEVRISPADLVVLSYPGPDRSIKLEDLQAGRAISRRYRNRRIGEFLKELELTEGRATGIPKILKVMAANGSPTPTFETDDERTSFIVRLPRHPKTVAATSMEVTMEVAMEVAALLNIVQGEMSRLQMQTAMGLKNADHFRKAYVQPALKTGYLEMTSPDQQNSRLQKYRLTEAGKKWLDTQRKRLKK